MQIHAFSDASKKAYAAAIFIRVETEEGVKVQLLQAKTRVAPVHPVTIPRLELLSCLISARLTTSVKSALELSEVPTFFWTDSMTELSWIKRQEQWGTFVANRVKEINMLSRREDWNHIAGALNPADLPSRGINPRKFVEMRWWEGPQWLTLQESDWPKKKGVGDESLVNQELRKGISSLLTKTEEKRPWYLPLNDYEKNLAVMVWVLRFSKATRGLKTEKSVPTVEELNVAELMFFRLVQGEVFHNVQNSISGLKVKRNSDHLMCVKTKLSHRDDLENFKYPILLPSNHLFVKLFVLDAHRKNSHGGIQFLMGLLRETVWIIHTRKTIKKVLRTCVTCRRFEAKKSDAPGCALPKDRVQSSRAFQTTGIDMAGPLTLKDGKKVYFIIFTCAVFRAVHLELVDSQDTADFILAFIRFCRRMNRPDVVYSDNGGNFVGANNLLKTLNWKHIERKFRKRKIRWVFNPPSAPWWGGFWERLIRSTKDLLRRMMGFGKLTRVELETCLCQAEWVINNRPLTFVTEDQDDLVPLTPAMFLRFMPNEQLPESEAVTIEFLDARKKKMTTLFENLQDRFRSEYLGMLVQRGKEKPRKFRVGEIVLVERENMKRIHWPMARILELIPGKEDGVRMVKLKTKTGVFLRPVQRLFPLEIDVAEVSPLTEAVTEGKLPREIQPKKELESELTKSTGDSKVMQTRGGRSVKVPIRFCDY